MVNLTIGSTLIRVGSESMPYIWKTIYFERLSGIYSGVPLLSKSHAFEDRSVREGSFVVLAVVVA